MFFDCMHFSVTLGQTILNDEQQMMWKEVVIVYSKIISNNLHRETK